MKILDAFTRNSILLREEERQAYEKVADEIERGEVSRGLWLKAIEQAGGDKKAAEGFYAKLRVREMRDEQELQRQNLKSQQELARRSEELKRKAEERAKAELALRQQQIREQEAQEGWKRSTARAFMMTLIFIVAILFLGRLATG